MEQIDRNMRIAYARACCEKNLYTTVKPEKQEKIISNGNYSKKLVVLPNDITIPYRRNNNRRH